MDRRDFIKAAAANVLACSAAPALLYAMTSPALAGRAAPATGNKPNILLILADDLGYAETGCQGGKDIPTPNIDSLAADGVRFTDGYVTCPVCSPTRAGLLTGRYQQRFGHEFNPGPAASDNFGLPLSEKTLADRLKGLGYATGIVGKWHLGDREGYMPQDRGFDEFFGFLGGAHPYNGSIPGSPIYRGRETVKEDEYLTDAFAREAVSFIDRHAGSPFFLYLPFNAVHSPLQADQARLKKFAHISDEKRRTFAAMQSAMDDGVGAVLAKLRALGLEQDTLVFFLSDNGGPTAQTTSSNLPLRGFKGQVFEGGTRIPYMVRWKSRLPAGKTYSNPVISLDIAATALAAAGGSDTSGLEGANLLPYLKGEKSGAPHDSLFWRYGQQYAVRAGDWKLTNFTGAAPMLFNIAGDISEAKDLSASIPDKLKELQSVYDSWNASNSTPLWTSTGAKRNRGKRAKRRRKQPK